jgi:hypothetical protein
MTEDVNNLWSADDELNEDELVNYLKGNLPAEDAHQIEKQMADSSFVNDGVEGLQQFSSAEKINSYVQNINTELQQKLAVKKRTARKGMQNLSWEFIAVIIVILLCLLGYAIIEMVRK